MKITEAKYSNIVEIANHSGSDSYIVKRGTLHHKRGEKVNANPILTTTIKVYANENENLDEKILNTLIINNEDISSRQHMANRIEIFKMTSTLKLVSVEDLAYLVTADTQKNRKIEYDQNSNKRAYAFKINLFQIR
jgi:hypothetical protein